MEQSKLQSALTAQQTPSASSLLNDYLTSIGKGDPKVTASYFTENGCIEAPYVASFGMSPTITGKPAIEDVMSNLLMAAPDFRLKKIRMIMETQDEVVAEYESEANMANGRSYRQLYIAHLIAKDGKIVCHREFLNTLSFVAAFFPNGLNDLISKN
jgi:ketosteroid isomerase-like protein